MHSQHYFVVTDCILRRILVVKKKGVDPMFYTHKKAHKKIQAYHIFSIKLKQCFVVNILHCYT